VSLRCCGRQRGLLLLDSGERSLGYVVLLPSSVGRYITMLRSKTRSESIVLGRSTPYRYPHS
jgi:hypothetical protein